MADTRTRLPLPNPVCIVTNMGAGRPQHFMLSTSHGVALMEKPAGSTLNLHSAAQMHAYSDAENAAARDCRTCKHLNAMAVTGPCVSDVPCTNADRYEPLPPVRLWARKAAP